VAARGLDAEALDDAERAIEEQDDKYQRRRAVLVQSPRSKKKEDVVAAVWKEAIGMGMRQYARGRKKSYEQLRDELVEKLLDLHIAVVVFDEAEHLSQTGLDVLRDIISTAETRSQDRISGSSYRAAGVGMVLIGTHQLKQRLLRSEEAGHRWVSIREVEDLTPTEAATVYRHFLPAFDEQANEMGKDDWNNYIRRKIVKGRKVPVRQVENHVRAYVRRTVAEADGDFDSKDDIPWDEELFEWTLARLLKPGVQADG
jgi:hypothetical protein